MARQFSNKIRQMKEGIEIPDEQMIDAQSLLSSDVPSIGDGSESKEEEEEEDESHKDPPLGLHIMKMMIMTVMTTMEGM